MDRKTKPTASWLPKRRLKAAPQITSRQELDDALAELSAIDTRKRKLAAELKKSIEHAKNGCEALQLVKVGRSTVSFSDRSKELQAAVEAYCNAHRDELLEAGKKSLELTHATISWRQLPKSIGFVDGVDEAAVLAKFEQRSLSKIVRACLATIAWISTNLGQFLSVSFSLDKKRILQGVTDGTITDEDLAEAGLVISGGDDKFGLKLSEYSVAG